MKKTLNVIRLLLVIAALGILYAICDQPLGQIIQEKQNSAYFLLIASVAIFGFLLIVRRGILLDRHNMEEVI